MLGFYLKSLVERAGAGMRAAKQPIRIALLVTGMGLAAASPAGATSYYNVSAVAQIDGQFYTQFTNATPTLPQEASLIGGSGWSASASANDDDGGTVTADVGAPPNFSYGTNSYLQQLTASAGLTYRFSLLGADPGTIIPVLVKAAGLASISDPRLGGERGHAIASFQMGGPSGEILNYVADTYDDPTGSIGFTTDTIVYLQAGVTYGLSLYAYVTGQTDESLDEFSLPNGKYATFSAKVDPHFTILGDNAASYHFEGLPDSAIGETPSTVPEPGSWVMMICGFGVIGCAMRRRDRVAASAIV